MEAQDVGGRRVWVASPVRLVAQARVEGGYIEGRRGNSLFGSHAVVWGEGEGYLAGSERRWCVRSRGDAAGQQGRRGRRVGTSRVR